MSGSQTFGGNEKCVSRLRCTARRRALEEDAGLRDHFTAVASFDFRAEPLRPKWPICENKNSRIWIISTEYPHRAQLSEEAD